MTELYGFQRTELDETWSREAWGLNWDMGTGKSLTTIATAERLAAAGKIDAMLVLAPNGVHRNWVVDELPKHLSADLAGRTRTLLWTTPGARTKKRADALSQLLETGGFRILAISYDGLMTEAGTDAVRRLLKARRCLAVLDESHMVKTPGAARTKRVLALSAHAPYRRILTGTLVPDKPFDVYAQIRFLDPRAWHAVGCGSFQAFKAQFGIWEQRYAARAGRLYPELLGYRNLELLQQVVAKYVSRVRKDEVLSELPPKVYQRRYFDLSPEQKRLYKDLRDEAMTWLASGDLVTAPLVITRMMRMQQVTSGYLPADDTGDVVAIPGKNPRLDLLVEIAEGLGHQAIIWTRYRRDVDLILERLSEAGLTSCRYDGACSDEESAEARERFRSGAAQFFVSNPAKGGTGLTLTEAKTEIFYSTDYKLAARLQAEDRAHRIGQDQSVAIVDLVGMLSDDEPTLDLAILRSLQEKRDVAAIVQGDEAREWLGL